MAKVEVEVSTKSSAFGAGLARVEAQTEEFRRKLSRKFSLADVAKGALQGLGIFGAENIAEKITSPWREAAEYTTKIAENMQRAAAAVKSFISGRNADSPERQLQGMQVEQGRLQRNVEARQKSLNSMDDNIVIGGIPIPNVKKLLATRDLTEMIAELQEASVATENLKRDIEKQNEAIAEEKAAILDRRRVRRGEITEIEAARNALERANDRQLEALMKNGGGIANKRADLAVLNAQDRIDELGQKQGLSVTASSLARIGGGGGLFAGSSSVVHRELQAHTTLLKTIATNTARTNNGASFTFRR